MNRFILAFLLMFGSLTAFSQVVSSGGGTGDWNDPDSWTPVGIPTVASGTIMIQDGHTITVSDIRSADQIIVQSGGSLIVSGTAIFTVAAGAGDDLTIASGGNLILQTGGSLTIQNQPAPPPPKRAVIRVFGNFNNAGTINNASASNLIFETGSIYDHQYTTSPGTIPTASWDINSTCQITGYTSNNAAPSGLGQSFGNFIWNTTSQTDFIDLNGALTTVNGDLSFIDIPFFYVYLTSISNYTLNVGGDLLIDNSYFGFNSTAIASINVAGDVLLSDNGDLNYTFDGNLTIDVEGNYEISGGTTNFTYGGVADIDLNVLGNFTISDSPVINNGGGGDYNLTFDGSALQTFTSTTALSDFDYNISESAIVAVSSSSYFSGGGDFILNNLSELRVGSLDASGAIQNGTSGGNIRVSGTRTYNTGATIVYNGSGAQFIGTGHPSTSGVNLEINNASGVSLIGDISISGDLALTAGNLAIGSNQLTLSSGINTASGAISVTSDSDIIIDGTGTLGTFPFASATPSLNNFTVNRASEIVVFEDDVSITGALALTAGDLDIRDQSLNMSGTISGSGNIWANTESTINITGTGAFGTLQFDPSGNTLGTFVLNRSLMGMVTLQGSLTISNALTLSQGTFNNDASLFMGDGSLLTKNSNAIIQGNSPETNPGDLYNLTYTNGAQTTGSEMPLASETETLGNLTIQTSAEVTLDQDLQVNGEVTLTSGSLGIGANTLTILGNYNRSGGSLSTYSGLVEFAGNTTISGVPNFVNIRLTENSTLTMPNGIVGIAGNIQFISGSIFNPNEGTVTFNGAANQTLAGGGATFANFGVNKTGGNVAVTSAVNLTGRLTFTSSTEFNANGLLTLLSTSDGASGNSSIGVVPSGASVTGEVIVQRYMNPSENQLYRYLSSPVTNATVAQWQDDFLISGTWTGADGISNDASMFIYDETALGDRNAGYLAYPNQSTGSASDPITPGVGYTAFVRAGSEAVVDVQGPVNQGDVVINLTFTDDPGQPNGTEDGWNLVGNPYPSTLNWDNIFSRGIAGNFNATAYVSDNGSGSLSYRMWNGTTGDDEFRGRIAKGQAFWVKTFAPSPSLTLVETDKTNTTGSFYREAEPKVLEIKITGVDNWDMTAIQLNEESTAGFDQFYDGVKFFNEKINLYTSTNTGENLGINTLDNFGCASEFNLSLTDVDEGNYTFEFSRMTSFEGAYNIILEDSFTGESINLLEQESYSFSVTADPTSFGSERFKLNFDAAIVPNLELVVTTNEICSGDDGVLNIENSEIGVVYSALFSDEIIGQAAGTGADVSLFIDKANLSEGENEIQITAETEVCSGFTFNESVIVKVNKQPNLDVELMGMNTCVNSASMVVINNSEMDVMYKAYISGELVSEGSGNGGDLELMVTNEYLSLGDNEVVIKASTTTCPEVNLNNIGNITVLSNPRLDLNVSGSNTCGDNDSEVKIEDSEDGVIYQLFVGDNMIDEVVGNGSDLEVIVNSNLLESGGNQITINASNGICESNSLNNSVEITKTEEVVISYIPDNNTLESSYTSHNQWFLNDTMLEGENGQTLKISEMGNYTVEVSFESCITTASYEYSVTDLKNTLEESIRIYPLPSTEILNVVLDISEFEPLEFELIDLKGNIVRAGIINKEGSHVKIPVNNLSGLYIFKLRSGSFNIIKKVTIK